MIFDEDFSEQGLDWLAAQTPEKLIEIMFEALQLMQQYNGRSLRYCVCEAAGFEHAKTDEGGYPQGWKIPKVKKEKPKVEESTNKDKAMKFELGVYARDIVTGFQGTITAYAKHLTGCDQFGVNPGLDKDGKLQATEWFDENRLELVEDKPKVSIETSKVKGGPNRDNPKI